MSELRAWIDQAVRDRAVREARFIDDVARLALQADTGFVILRYRDGLEGTADPAIPRLTRWDVTTFSLRDMADVTIEEKARALRALLDVGRPVTVSLRGHRADLTLLDETADWPDDRSVPRET